ncbi:Crp/Fnr family transcriptional regulator [Phenylobacterium immobile]|uniref:Crp/Fnr family transcriptional regulator n=1 Tax=Phenylobacterium immobile TaxID=21 RepID=UPI00159EE870|nr:Crp/Fnr family transcriptional regulator [Phenylobacterium immobile]
MSDKGRPGLLDVLDQDAQRDLIARARTMRVRKGQFVLARGETSTEVFLVREGRLNVLLYASDGREVSLRELTEGQLFGELSAIDGETRSVGVVALTDARLLAISQSVFQALVRDNVAAAGWLVRRLTSQVRSLTDRVFELSALNVRARLHCELIRIARSRGSEDQPAPTHAELANRIGTHREAVTRELKVLADRKIIKSGRRRIEFLDMAGLEEVVAANLRAPVGEEGWW